MNHELNRRVAIEVMEESEPPPQKGNFWDDESPKGNWWRGAPVWNEWAPPYEEWQPVNFSDDFCQAERAAKTKLSEIGGRLHLTLDSQGWVAFDGLGNRGVPDEKAATAICHLLLVLAERRKS